MLGPWSPLAVFTVGPRFTGVSQGHSTQARCATQMSAPPKPPARFDVKKRLRSSGDNAQLFSVAAVLIDAPTFTGGDHSELPKKNTEKHEGSGSESLSHASSRGE